MKGGLWCPSPTARGNVHHDGRTGASYSDCRPELSLGNYGTHLADRNEAFDVADECSLSDTYLH